MTPPAPPAPGAAEGYTAERYFGLVAEGALEPDDRVELLEGVIVTVSPRSPRHDAGANRAGQVLWAAVGQRAVVRVQSSLVIGPRSVPEPDVAVVAGKPQDYDTAHPTSALLVVEGSDTSLPQDRLTKTRIYAAAGVPEYWIVNLRDDRLEMLREPDREGRTYRERLVAGRGERVGVVALGGVTVAVDDLLPCR